MRIRHVTISIPYGSIKRGFPHKRRKGGSKFQFLMVRLKGGCPYRLPCYQGISIPYGSIKSKHVVSHFPQYAGFQFLMVRLKDAERYAARRTFVISIPYGSIKRKTGVGDSTTGW